VIDMLRKDLSNAIIERLDGAEQGTQLGRVGLDREAERLDDRRIDRQRLRDLDGRQARLDDRRRPAIVGLVELPDRTGPGGLQR
jgi:hypothetical protein